MKPPFTQGDLDSLCGIYASVNAYRLLYNAPKEECESKFREVVEYLSEKRKLKKAMLDGLGPVDVLDLLRYVSLDVQTPWMGQVTPPLDAFWKSIDDWEGVVIVGVQGYHDHYSVVRRISNRSLFLYDSGGLVRLQRIDCTTGNKGRHRLRPAQSFFVSRKVDA